MGGYGGRTSEIFHRRLVKQSWMHADQPRDVIFVCIRSSHFASNCYNMHVMQIMHKMSSVMRMICKIIMQIEHCKRMTVNVTIHWMRRNLAKTVKK